jgi:F-type H+-transporting ATPase subunit alpha
VKAFEDGLLHVLRAQNADLLNGIRDTRDLGKDLAAKLKDVVESFAKTFA